MAEGKVFVSDGSEWVDITNTADVTALTDSVADKADSSTVTAHISNTSNPHAVTKTQVGLSNVDNTSDSNKPISTATQSALNAKATVAQFDALTSTVANQLATKANSTDLTAHTGNTSNPHSVTKSQVGLANVDNTSDLNKPISTATQTQLTSLGSRAANLEAIPNNKIITTQSALEAAVLVGGDIYCDSNTVINLTSTITVGVPARIYGGTFTKSSGVAFLITSSNVELSGITITGGGTAAGYDNTQKLIFAQGTSSATTLQNININNCRLTASRGNNIWLQWCKDSYVRKNYISTFLYSGIMIISGKDIMIRDNTVRDSALSSGVVNVYGISLTDESNIVNERTTRCTVVGNHVDMIDWEGISTHGGKYLTITGNQVTGCARGIALITGNGTRLAVPEDCLVTGNTVDASTGRVTMVFGVALVGRSGVGAWGTITGNQLLNYTSPFSVSLHDRSLSLIKGNNKPLVDWTPISLTAGEFTGNATYTPEYMVDGNDVYLRGGVSPASGGLAAHSAVGTLTNSHAWPSILTFVGYIKGSNTGAGNGMLSVDADGSVKMWYGTGTDSYSYFLHGSFKAQ